MPPPISIGHQRGVPLAPARLAASLQAALAALLLAVLLLILATSCHACLLRSEI